MSSKLRNFFLLFGIAALIVMAFSFEDGYEQIRRNIVSAGLYLPAVIGVWVFVYALNALAFQIIVNHGTHDKHLSYRHSYKLTVSGFAFSYTTPFGFGGGPYRVMELAHYIGTPRAMSSVVLYSMMPLALLPVDHGHLRLHRLLFREDATLALDSLLRLYGCPAGGPRRLPLWL